MSEASLTAQALDTCAENVSEAVWAKLSDDVMTAAGYVALAGTVHDTATNQLKYRWLTVAKPSDPNSARGTFVDFTTGTILNLPRDKAWTIFEEAMKKQTTCP